METKSKSISRSRKSTRPIKVSKYSDRKDNGPVVRRKMEIAKKVLGESELPEIVVKSLEKARRKRGLSKVSN